MMAEMNSEHPWRDKETLERLHHEEGLNQEEMAERLGCTRRTVSEWFSRHGIQARMGAPRQEYAYYETDQTGHERWICLTQPDRGATVYVHRLLAVAEYGIDSVKGNHAHHKNGVPWDNRPENIEVLGPREHVDHHHKTTWSNAGEANPNAKLTWDEVNRIRRCRGLVSAKRLAEEFGVRPDQIRRIWDFEAWDPSESDTYNESGEGVE